MNFCKNNKPYMMLIITVLLMFFILIIAPLFHDFLIEILNVTAYTVWHNVFEFSSIIISICIFCVAYYSYEQNQNFRNLVLGSTLLLMSFVDFFHTLSYKGMPDFLIPYSSSNRATTFWIIARLIGGIGLFITSITPVKFKLQFNKIFFFLIPFASSFLILNLVTYHPGLIPVMYIDGTGLTQTKITLEVMTILFLLAAIISFLYQYHKDNNRYTIFLTCALLIGIFSELSFTLYIDVYGIYNYLGHLLKFVMYFIIFRIIFVQNIKQPYLELSEARDEIKNYADNLDKIVEQRTEQINKINKKLLDDLEYARGIQISMLPKKLPESVSVAFEACYYPAERVSGDFYNVFKIDDTKIGMYIGDVSGHGVSAAMLTVFLNQSLKAKKENAQGIKTALLPSEALKNLYIEFNQTDFNKEVYIVVLYGIYDLVDGTLTYSSAGLNVAPLILNYSGEVSDLPIKGLPICKLLDQYDFNYTDSVIKLKCGDKVLFYTDGLVDAENLTHEIYSDSRLKFLLQNQKSSNASQLAESISANIFRFVGENKLKDDITFFIMEIK